MIALSLLMYLLGANAMSISGIVMLYGSILIVGGVFASLAIKHQRDRLEGGLINYGRALLIGMLTVFLAMFISSIWNYILINFIDPEYINTLKEQFVETWGQNMPPDALEKTMEEFDKSGDFGKTMMNGLSGGAFFGLIIGLISAAFMKRSPTVSMH